MNNSRGDQTSSYADLAGKTYTVITDAVADAQHRVLSFGKSWFEIVSKPYASGAIEDTQRETFARANALVDLSVKELQTAGSQAAKVGASLSQLGSEMQEVYAQAFRGVLQMGVSNANFFKDAADRSIDGVNKRGQEYGQPTPVVAGTVKKN